MVAPGRHEYVCSLARDFCTMAREQQVHFQTDRFFLMDFTGEREGEEHLPSTFFEWPTLALTLNPTIAPTGEALSFRKSSEI